MKKSVSLKLVVFSFLLVATSISYSEPKIEAGTGVDSTKAGIDNEASGEKSTAFGFENRANGRNSSAFGYNNEASEKNSSAFGNQNKAIGEKSSAIGDKNEASGSESSVLGGEYKVTGSHSGAFSRGTYDEINHKHLFLNEGGNSYMIGNGNSIASGSNDNFILGNNVNIGVDSNGRHIQSSVVLGHGSSATESDVVSVGSSDYRRRIVNIRRWKN